MPGIDTLSGTSIFSRGPGNAALRATSSASASAASGSQSVSSTASGYGIADLYGARDDIDDGTYTAATGLRSASEKSDEVATADSNWQKSVVDYASDTPQINSRGGPSFTDRIFDGSLKLPDLEEARRQGDNGRSDPAERVTNLYKQF